MIHDGIIDIATGLSASTKKWKNKKVKWSKLIDKLSKPVVTNETHAQFMAANKTDQSKIKDVGGFVSYRKCRKVSKNSCNYISMLKYKYVIDSGNFSSIEAFQEYLNRMGKKGYELIQ